MSIMNRLIYNGVNKEVIIIARERKFSTETLFRETKRALLQHGYEGLTFTVLAERLQVSRGAIYKYYENKEELVADLMIYEMNEFLHELQRIEEISGFDDQFHFLVDLIFRKKEIHQYIAAAEQIPLNHNEKVKVQKKRLEQMHLEMYALLRNFYRQGLAEGKLRPDLPEELVLGFIFQSIMIPNHFGVPVPEWVDAVKKILRHGIMVSPSS
jgi:Transcriptional regulator